MNKPQQTAATPPYESLDAVLLAMSEEEVLDALERDDPQVGAALEQLHETYAALAVEAFRSGQDYLDALEPDDDTPFLAVLAMEFVAVALEEELAGLD